jgi:hypothetical protein
MGFLSFSLGQQLKIEKNMKIAYASAIWQLQFAVKKKVEVFTVFAVGLLLLRLRVWDFILGCLC